MSKTKRFLAASAATIATLFTLAACDLGDKFTEPFKDAPRTGHVNNDAADIITSPDGFSNAATKCDHGNRLYVAYHGDSKYGAIAVVSADPSCR